MADPVWVDGVTPLNALNLNKLQTRDEKGAANGYSSLDSTGKVPAAQLPAAVPGVPTGVGLPWWGPAGSVPAGWLLCDGSAVSRTTYAALFAVIGTAFGVGDGSTTFTLPDTRGRAVVGVGTHADVSTLGGNDGVAVANRRPKHAHTNGVTATPALTLPDHAHNHTLALPNHEHALQLSDNNGSPFNALNTVSPSIVFGTRTLGSAAAVGNPTSNPAIGGAVVGVTSTPAIPGTVAIGGAIGAAGGAVDAPCYIAANMIIKT